MPLRPEQIETFLKAVNERTPPAPLARPLTPAQRQYADEQLPLAFESIGIQTVSDQALKAVLGSESYLYAIRERALYVQPAELFSRRFFRFRGRMPVLYAMLVRLFTDAAGEGEHKIRIWNPFCGCGADTYSLAAMARLAQTTTGLGIRTIEIIGTDVLPTALKYAGEARYEYHRPDWIAHRRKCVDLFGEECLTEDMELPISTEHLPQGVETFFNVSRLPENGYVITPSEAVRKITSFRFVNPLRIADVGQLGGFNVVISFSGAVIGETPVAEKYRAAMACAVRPGGYLILPEAPPAQLKFTPPSGGLEMRESGLYCRVR